MEHVVVRPAPPERRGEALALLTSPQVAPGAAADAQSISDQAESGGLSLEGLLVAEAGGSAIGAALYVLQPAGVAFVWPPVVSAGGPLAAGVVAPQPSRVAPAAEFHTGQHAGRPLPRGTGSQSVLVDTAAQALLDEICRQLDARGCRLAQCLLEPGSLDGPLLERHGFLRLTELSYLERLLDGPLPAAPEARLDVVGFDPQTNRARFAALLAATYEGTQDCPELNGRRTADEALTAHRASGRFDPRLWKLYRAGGRDAALLLLTDHPEMRAWEVVYMGVAPPARGRGIGRAMLIDALHEARCAGREAIVLAVDIRNRFALSLYEQLGFRELCRRVVHLRLVG